MGLGKFFENVTLTYSDNICHHHHHRYFISNVLSEAILTDVFIA